MGTRSIVGVVGRDGRGCAGYVSSDGYPTGIGVLLLTHWNDAESVERLLAGGSISDLGVSKFPLTIEYFEKYYDGIWVEATESSQRIYYLPDRSKDIYPVSLEPSDSFFERKWPWDIEYLYLLTPDGWLGCEHSEEGELPRNIRPVAYMVNEYRALTAARRAKMGEQDSPHGSSTIISPTLTGGAFQRPRRFHRS